MAGRPTTEGGYRLVEPPGGGVRDGDRAPPVGLDVIVHRLVDAGRGRRGVDGRGTILTVLEASS